MMFFSLFGPNFKVLICSKISSTLFFVFTSLAAVSLYFLPETNGMTLAQTLEEAEIRFREQKFPTGGLSRRNSPGHCCDSNAQALAIKPK